MFGGAQGEPSTSKSQAQTNTTNSDIKTLVDSWYKTNIVDKNLGNKISDTLFCNDRTTVEGLGYGKNRTSYGATARTNVWNTDPSKVKPIFTCPQKNDAFTVSDDEKGNGDLTYPVGLITADEVVAAGSGKFQTDNLNYYLYKGSTYWSFSPLNFSGMFSVAFCIHPSGFLFNNVVSNTSYVAPVINLKAEYVKTFIGDGTINNPYREVIK